jgi:anaerobic selenocysteine-containing dehydrogenase
MVTEQSTTRKTTCHGCTRRCGLLVTVEDGRPVALRGDDSQPMSRGFFCHRGKAMALEQPVDRLRLRHPLKRIGRRGEGKWTQISWEQALDEIAGRIRKIKEENGPESVTALLDSMISTGLNFSGTRFMKKLGSPNYFTLGGQVCYANSAIIEMVTYGQDTVCDRANSMCTVIVGCNPAFAKPEFFRYIQESKKKGGKVIAVDPYRTKTVETADLWLQHRPGSEGAILLAWLNVIIHEGLYDSEFVERWTNAPYLVRLSPRKILRESDILHGGDPRRFVAWDRLSRRPVAFNVDLLRFEAPEVSPSLTGEFEVKLADGSVSKCATVWELLRQRVEPYAPERISEMSWVPAEKIRQAARMYAGTRPGNFFPGFAMDGIGLNANQCGRARSILNAVTGNLDVQGGQVMLNGPNPQVNMDTGTLPLEQHRKALGNDTYKLWSYETSMKLFEYQKRVGARIPPPFSGAHAPSVWRAIKTGMPYAVKALLCVGANPLLSGANIQGIDEALRKLDLLVVQDLYMTPTAELADYVTPAAPDDIENCRLYTGGPCTGWLEGHSLLSGERAVDPPGEARSDFEFFRELGVRLGQEWPWKTDEAYYDWQLKPLGFSSFREFHEKVQWSVPQPTYKKYVDKGFGTPSGKVEIYSSLLEELGYEPLPSFEEPPESPVRTPALWKEYPYVQGVMRHRYFYQSSYRNLPSLRKAAPDPLIHMHPETAKTNGLEEGDWVWIQSPSTSLRIKQRVRIFDGLDPRVLYPDYGWWFPERSAAEGNHGVWESNINVLTQDGPEVCCPMIGSWFFNANLLKIEKA